MECGKLRLNCEPEQLLGDQHDEERKENKISGISFIRSSFCAHFLRISFGFQPRLESRVSWCSGSRRAVGCGRGWDPANQASGKDIDPSRCQNWMGALEQERGESASYSAVCLHPVQFSLHHSDRFNPQEIWIAKPALQKGSSLYSEAGWERPRGAHFLLMQIYTLQFVESEVFYVSFYCTFSVVDCCPSGNLRTACSSGGPAWEGAGRCSVRCESVTGMAQNLIIAGSLVFWGIVLVWMWMRTRGNWI